MPMYDRKAYKNPKIPRANESSPAGQREASAPSRAGGMLQMAAQARARQPKAGAPPIPQTEAFSAAQQRPAGLAPLSPEVRRQKAAAIIAQEKNLGQAQFQQQQPGVGEGVGAPAGIGDQAVGNQTEMKGVGVPGSEVPPHIDDKFEETSFGGEEYQEEAGPVGGQAPVPGSNLGEQVAQQETSEVPPAPPGEPPGEEYTELPAWNVDPEQAVPTDEQIGTAEAKEEGWTEFTDDQGNSYYKDNEGNFYNKDGDPVDPASVPQSAKEYGYGHGDTDTALAQHKKYEKSFSDYLAQSTGIPEEELQGQIAQIQMASSDQMIKFAQQMAARGVGASGLVGQGMGQIASQTVGAIANLRFENAKLAIDEKLNKMKSYMAMYGQMMSEQNRKEIFNEMSQLEKDKFQYEKDQNSLADNWTKLNNLAAMAQAWDDDAIAFAFKGLTEKTQDTDGDGVPDAPMSIDQIMDSMYVYPDNDGIMRLGLSLEKGGKGKNVKAYPGGKALSYPGTNPQGGDWSKATDDQQKAIYAQFTATTGKQPEDDAEAFAAWVKENYGWANAAPGGFF